MARGAADTVGAETPSADTKDARTGMDDFRKALEGKLARNEEIEREREEARHEMDRIERERAELEEQRRREEEEAREAKHAELVEHLQDLIAQIGEIAGDSITARTGWTPSGEEFIAKLSTSGLAPRRSLFVELDRDDDEVLARWASDVGDSVELWRLGDFDRDMLGELVLNVIDEQLWRGRSTPPAFPGH